jgi:uncharacterized protein YqeY
MALSEQIASDLTAAMKARDTLKTGTLRMAKAALKNREIEKRSALDDAEAAKVLHTLVKQREEAAAQFRTGNRLDLVEKELAEAALLKAYLPSEASDDEIQGAVEQAVGETGAASPRDIGKVMKAALARLQALGKAVDGKKVNEAARCRLG